MLPIDAMHNGDSSPKVHIIFLCQRWKFRARSIFLPQRDNNRFRILTGVVMFATMRRMINQLHRQSIRHILLMLPQIEMPDTSLFYTGGWCSTNIAIGDMPMLDFPGKTMGFHISLRHFSRKNKSSIPARGQEPCPQPAIVNASRLCVPVPKTYQGLSENSTSRCVPPFI